jgi:hypothetical protein
MTYQEFQSRMTEAKSIGRLSARAGYYEGYVRGLRRFYHGPNVDTLQEHEKWLRLLYDRDETEADRGRGYQHGLQGIRPVRY